MFVERTVFVNELDEALVVVQRGGEQFGVHPGAERALQIVEVDDGYLGGGVSANRPAGEVDGGAGIFGQIEFRHANERLVVVRNHHVEDLGSTVARQGDGKRVVTGYL